MERTAYKEAGVDVSKLDRFRAIGLEVSRLTLRPEIEEIGSGKFFSDLGKICEHFGNPREKEEADGIGGKQELTAVFGYNRVAGRDIVTCNVSDILRHGATPYKFVLGFSFTDIKDEVFREVMIGVCQACKESEVTLTAGETAQMPRFYKKGRYDLLGTALGVVEEEKILCPEKVEVGDVILGVSSSGLHTNGYSLAIKAIEGSKIPWNLQLPPFGKSLTETLLEPERNYTKAFLDLFSRDLDLHQVEHITGGGLTGRLEGVGQGNLSVIVDHNSWEIAPIFELLGKWGKIDDEQMFATFNMGIGMVIVLPKKEMAEVRAILEDYGHKSWFLGKVAKGRGDKVIYKK